MQTESENAPRFAIGSTVRIRSIAQIGTVAAYAAPGPDGQQRVLIDRPHGYAGQAILRQHFAESDLEAVE